MCSGEISQYPCAITSTCPYLTCCCIFFHAGRNCSAVLPAGQIFLSFVIFLLFFDFKNVFKIILKRSCVLCGGSMINILFEFQITVPLVGKWMERKFQKVKTFADVAGQSSKNWNSDCSCSKTMSSAWITNYSLHLLSTWPAGIGQRKFLHAGRNVGAVRPVCNQICFFVVFYCFLILKIFFK